jgi:redox-sensitive bicupin YhaK (pirin superfamily)
MTTLPLLSFKKSLQGKRTAEGDGAEVCRTVGTNSCDYYSPFLLLDEFYVRKPAGFPDHPHRGFETVTYMLEGAFIHEDNKGNKGTIQPGEVQWMTAGRGIVHSEMPATSGLNHGMQLWINLKRQDKMIAPQYQDLTKDTIPKKTLDNGTQVVVIAGTSQAADLTSPLTLRTKVLYLHVKLPSNTIFEDIIPANMQGFVYGLGGTAECTNRSEKTVSFKKEQALFFEKTSEESKLEIKSLGEGYEFVIIAGEPIDEPMARYGPFVMNNQNEINQAVRDFQNGLF